MWPRLARSVWLRVQGRPQDPRNQEQQLQETALLVKFAVLREQREKKELAAIETRQQLTNRTEKSWTQDKYSQGSDCS